jgi:amidase
MSTDVDAFASATEMLRVLQAGQVSAGELLNLHLQRIERYNGSLNAIVTPDFERAHEAAAAADAALTRGDRAPLLGLPLTVKDSIDVQGLPTTAGLPERAEHRASADSLLVRRLRDAGAVIIGKTNIPPMLADWQAANPVFGRTNNPWDLERTPGGSTGGGGAALAAGLTPLEFGSDIGGSVRYPAAWCGVYGHRPSVGVVPQSGHFPGSSLPNPTITLPVLGPLARTAADLERALDVIAGPDVGDDVGWRLELPPARHDRLSDFRVAVLPRPDWLPIDPEIAAGIDTLASRLSKLGATVGEAQPEGFGDLREHHALYWMMVTSVMSLGLPADLRRERAALGRARGQPFDEAGARGLESTAGDYIAWHDQREAIRDAWRAFFHDWDVLLAPIVIVPAPPHTTLRMDQRVVTIDGQSVPHVTQMAYAGLSVLGGQPATAFPLGLTRAGLPIGIQAIGPYLEDRTPIRFAGLVADEIGGFQPPPGYDQE